MDGEGKRIETSQQRRCWRIEIFIANAENSSGSRGGGLLPAPVSDDLFEWNSIARAAPRCNDDLGVEPYDFLWRNLPARGAKEFSSRRVDHLLNPFLRGDDRLAPLFAKDTASRRVGCA